MTGKRMQWVTVGCDNLPPKPHRPDCPGGDLCTLDDAGSHADILAGRGWGVGDKLVGDEGWGAETLEILYVSQQTLLCRDSRGREGSWVLYCRCWGKPC